MTAVRRLQDQLYDFSCIEITANELWIGLMLFEGHNGEMIGFHDGVTYCGDTFEEILSMGRGGSRQRFDENNLRRGLGFRGIDTLDSDRHCRATACFPDCYGVVGRQWGSHNAAINVEAGGKFTLDAKARDMIPLPYQNICCKRINNQNLRI